MKMNRFLFAVGISLAMAITFSCSDDSSDDDDNLSSSSIDGDSGNSSSSGITPGGSSSSVRSSSSEEPVAAGYCVIDYDEACFDDFGANECAQSRGIIDDTCPSDFLVSPQACFLYGNYCELDPYSECLEADGVPMSYKECLGVVGNFLIGSCIDDYWGECDEGISKYTCEYMNSGTFINGACPTIGACSYYYGGEYETCVDEITQGECYDDYDGLHFALGGTCPIQYCAFTDDDGDIGCEDMGEYGTTIAECIEEDGEFGEFGGWLETDPDYCDYTY